MNLFTKPQKENSISINILWELLIKNGLPLTEKVQTITINRKEQIFITNNNKIVFCLDSLAVQFKMKY